MIRIHVDGQVAKPVQIPKEIVKAFEIDKKGGQDQK